MRTRSGAVIGANRQRQPQRSHNNQQQRQHYAPDLPEQVIVNILARVPQHHRLAFCALVNKSWCTGAIAATTQVLIPSNDFDERKAEGLNNWLQLHAREVRSMQVPPAQGLCALNFRSMQLLVLDCASLPRLEVLVLDRCRLQLQDSSNRGEAQSSSTEAAALLPALQCLRLNSVHITPSMFAALQLPMLTTLELSNTPYTLQREQLETAVSGLLQRLPQLRALTVDRLQGGNKMLQHISSLQHLESCSIHKCYNLTPKVLSGLCSKLTALTFAHQRCHAPFDASVLPAAGWPHLKHLSVQHTPLQPSILARMTSLVVLQLVECRLLPTEEVEVVIGQKDDPAAAGASELLAALAHLTELQELDLYEIDLQIVDAVAQRRHRIAQQEGAAWAPRPSDHLTQFSSLTASSKLQRLALVLRDEDVETQPLPQGGCFEAGLFDAGRQLTALTELVLDALDDDVLEGLVQEQVGSQSDEQEDFSDWDDEESSEEGGDVCGSRDPYVDFFCVDSFDMTLIAAYCPNLQRLTLNSVVADNDGSGTCEAIRQLRRELKGLTHLCVGGPWLKTTTAAALATLTTLTSLEIKNAPNLRAAGLEKLTALRELRVLEVEGVGYGRELQFSLRHSALEEWVQTIKAAQQREDERNEWRFNSLQEDSELSGEDPEDEDEDEAAARTKAGWYKYADSMGERGCRRMPGLGSQQEEEEESEED